MAPSRPKPGTAFIPFVGDLANILCIEEERVVAADNCVRYRGLALQIPESAPRHHFVKTNARVLKTNARVLEYWNGAIAIFHGPREIARFHADGSADLPQIAPKKSVA